MKKYSFFLILILSGWLFYRSQGSTESIPVVETETTLRSPEPVKNNDIVQQNIVPRTQAPTNVDVGINPNPVMNKKSHVNPPDAVSFKIEDGFGIAFGDVILGAPKKGTPDTGQSKVPTAEKWDTPQIPYQIAPDFTHPERIKEAVEYFNKNTIVTFVAYGGQPDAVVFQNGTGCKSYVGKVGGHQPVLLEAKCRPQEIIHELMHVLGFSHEQSRRDRDQYVKVNWENIDPEHLINFDMVPESYMSLVPYTDFDFQSIMIYSPHAFAIDPKLNTLDPIGKEAISPTLEGLSREDILRIAKLYH